MNVKQMKGNVKQAVKVGAVIKGVNMNDVARLSGRDQATLSNMIGRGKPSLRSLASIFNAIDAKIIIEYSNGQTLELLIDK